ncbi:Rtf2 RING-finger-domain-containing protein [Pelagophyceae sp. CCMP2097]|nr:Rtf2 RING-finger-domain-containing protein [Pelagophyceae sp. CCMP2097]|mmetsp:Transcript_29035/g.97928  ORF Transcript_29035/g.97928 Transcript_29035/m.97928 type:complete len:324 (+) Transcript_29035:170-1141(+)
MGGDGGVIATQRAFMRGTYGSQHSKGNWRQGQNFGAGDTGGDAVGGVDRRRVLAVRVRNCALSAERLAAPVVADELGNLFNKLPLLSALSARALPERLSHIRGLRDLVDCRLVMPTDRDGAAAQAGAAAYFSGEDAPVTACPVTGEGLDGSKAFVVVRTTGWLLSENAVKQLGHAAMQPEYGPFEKADLIRVAPEDYDQIVEMNKAMLDRRVSDKLKRKEAKKAKRDDVPAVCDDGDGVEVDAEDGTAKKAKKEKRLAPPPPKRKASEAVTEAQRIVQLAKERTAADRHNSRTIDDIFHDDGGKKHDPKSLFITTASRRYNLN